jgi:hypothetical protein
VIKIAALIREEKNYMVKCVFQLFVSIDEQVQRLIAAKVFAHF